MESDIVSILNLKNGVGCSCLAWNIAHTLELNLYQHDKAMHHIYNAKRKETFEDNIESMLPFMIETLPIVKNQFHNGVYDLGSDINYAHIKKIIAKSKVIIIPCELGHETLIKTIATIRFVSALNQKASIFIVINKLLPLGDTTREKKYTQDAEELIEQNLDYDAKFFYVRHSFTLFRCLDAGFFFLDNYITKVELNKRNAIKPTIKPFELLQHIQWYNIHTMSNEEKKNKQLKESSFDVEYKRHFDEFTKHRPFKDVVDRSLLSNNQRAIRDMLILTIPIKRALEGKE